MRALLCALLWNLSLKQKKMHFGVFWKRMMSRNVAILFTLNIVLTVLLSSILVSDIRKTIQFYPCWFHDKKRYLFYLSKFWFPGQISIHYFLFMIKSLVTFSAFPIRDNSFHEWGATPKEPQNHAARKNWLLFSKSWFTFVLFFD